LLMTLLAECSFINGTNASCENIVDPDSGLSTILECQSGTHQVQPRKHTDGVPRLSIPMKHERRAAVGSAGVRGDQFWYVDIVVFTTHRPAAKMLSTL
jgi:hypothetical protein